jgi:DNA-binding GntR family transcriptional regulator
MTTSASGAVDPYLRVANAIRGEIKERELGPGTKLTPSRELAQQFRVSEMTIGNAIRVLRDEGIVYTTKRGTFVGEPPADLPGDSDLVREVAALKGQVRDLEARVAAIESSR